MVLQCVSTKTLPYIIRFADSLPVVQRNGQRCLSIMIRERTSHRCYSTAGDSSSSPVDATKAVAPAASATGKATGDRQAVGMTDHKVNKLEKIFLVWGGKYKTVAEVPDLVSQGTLERARNKARIKINIMMALATLFGCLLMVLSGKKAQKEGESVVKMNEEWHKQMREESKETAK